MPKGPNGEKRPADVIGGAIMVGRIATGEIEDDGYAVPGRKASGISGAKKRSENLTPSRRAAIAKKAAAARWGWKEVEMVADKDGIDAFVFADGVELADFRCFRGDRADVDPADIKAQVHSAFMQRKMKRATISSDPPTAPGEPQNVREFVAELAKPC
jgi:hypothetical protein